jgi:LmbE family N-acetylglucosaminyl deacetylase
MDEQWQRAVAVVAHPDDLEYGVASAVARWTAQGKEVAYVLATSGEAGIDGLDPAECGPLREQEERRSAAVVGVDHVEFLGHPDGLVQGDLALRRDLAAAIRRLRPEVLITMHFGLTWGPEGPVNHADHRAVGLATIDACRDAANRWLFPEAGERWDGVGAVYVAATEPATHYVDVSDWLDAGVASLREHRAYIDGLDEGFDPDGFLRSMAESAGQAVGCRYAVTFRRYEA